MNREQRREVARENGVPMAPAEPEPQGVQLSPVPVRTDVAVVDSATDSLVLLQVTTPQGVQGYFLSPDHARQLASHLVQHATAAASGLTIVGDVGLSGDGSAG